MSILSALKKSHARRVAQDKYTGETIRRGFKSKNTATAVYTGAVAVGVGLNVAVGKILDSKGYVTAAKAVYCATAASVGFDTPRHIRVVKNIRKDQ